MEAYQVIARKWRPQRFADVVGQEHITQTLKNAIVQGRSAHAYLFVGPRGIGKTSTARIFAKALNCLAPEAGEPCCQCESCQAIAEESCIDIIEIDAASQNSVDNIRDLRDEVMHVPVKCKYKVYIIDEVHMLTQQAWNALLKTIEEPPPHAKFLFATTEAHKVIPTIVSRCQRFDLRRIPAVLIARRLEEIMQTEQIKISNKAIEAIARAADGGLRDAQSLLDQMIAFFGADGNEEISEEQVLSLFGLTAVNEMENLVGAILSNHPSAVIANIHYLAGRGKNLETLFDELLDFLRGIQLCQLLSEPEVILETGAESIETYRKFGGSLKPGVLQRLLEVLAPIGGTLHNALNKQVYLETVILKAMRIAHAVQIEDLISRLNLIKDRNGLQVLEQFASGTESGIASQNFMPPSDGQSDSQGQGQVVVNEADTRSNDEGDQVDGTDVQVNEEPEVITEDETPVNSAKPENISETDSDPSEKEAESEVVIDQAEEEFSGVKDEVADYSSEDSDSSEDASEAVSPILHDLPSESKFSPESIWHRLIEDVGRRNPVLKMYMQEGNPVSFNGSILTVAYNQEFSEEHVQEVVREIPILNSCLHGICNDRQAVVSIQTRLGVDSHHSEGHQPKRRDLAEVRERVEKNQFIQETLDLFDGDIVDVHG